MPHRRHTAPHTAVEQVARAICDVQHQELWGSDALTWDAVTEGQQATYRKMAEAAIQAMQEQEVEGRRSA